MAKIKIDPNTSFTLTFKELTEMVSESLYEGQNTGDDDDLDELATRDTIDFLKNFKKI